MVKKLRKILEQEDEWMEVPGPKYGKLPPLKKGERWSNSGTENVPIDKIQTIQHSVSKKGVNRYKEDPPTLETTKARIHIDNSGNAYLVDGHHQYTANVLTNKKHMPAEVWRIVKD